MLPKSPLLSPRDRKEQTQITSPRQSILSPQLSPLQSPRQETNGTYMTVVPPEIFDEMVTNEGLSIAKMNKMGVRVILFFSTSLGCPYCQGTIDDIYSLKDELLKLNIVPVVCHSESNQIWDEFVNFGPNNKKFEELLHLDRTKWKQYFQLQSTLISFIKETIGSGVEELKRLQKRGIKGKFSWFTNETKNLLAAMFVVENSKIVSEYRKSSKSESMDIATIVLEPGKSSIQVRTSYYQCEYRKNKPVSKKSQLRDIENIKDSNLTIPNVDLTLTDVLTNDTFRQYFKVFAMSCFSVECILFYEEVMKYKAMSQDERKIFGAGIISLFLEHTSSSQVNTASHFVEIAILGVEKGEENAFDNIVSDLKTEVMVALFARFCQSHYFQKLQKYKSPSTIDRY